MSVGEVMRLLRDVEFERDRLRREIEQLRGDLHRAEVDADGIGRENNALCDDIEVLRERVRELEGRGTEGGKAA